MLKKVIPAALVLAMASNVCFAQSEVASKKGFFLGAGLNTIDTNSDIPEPDNYFIKAGYGFSENWSAELQYSDSYKDGSFKEELTVYVPEVSAVVDVVANGDVSMEITSLFLAYRTTGAFYWKAKAGYMDAKATFSMSTTANYEGERFTESASESASESGWAAGLGAGYTFGSSAIELEYLTSDDKVDIDSVALSFNYWF